MTNTVFGPSPGLKVQGTEALKTAVGVVISNVWYVIPSLESMYCLTPRGSAAESVSVTLPLLVYVAPLLIRMLPVRSLEAIV